MSELENNIKDFLRNREIQPSVDAWERMEKLLQEETKRKLQKLFYSTTIAASILLLICGWWFFQSTNTIPSQINSKESFVVETKNEVIPSIDKEIVNKKATQKQVHMVSHQVTKKKPYIKEVYTNPIENKEDFQDEYEVGELVLNESVIQKSDIGIQEKLVVHQSEVEISVNPELLLRSTNIERQIENVITDGQNFWKKVGEIHKLVQH